MSDESERTTSASLLSGSEDIEQILSKVDNTIFEDDDWNKVIDQTKSLATDWYKISVALGLPPDVIDGIRASAGDSYYYWSEALKQWIKQNYNTKKSGAPSWRTLLKAMAGANMRMCRKLAAEHPKREVIQAKSKDGSKGSPKVMTKESDEMECKSKNQVVQMQEVVHSKPHFSFPLLDLKKMDLKEKELLHQRLFAETEQMVYKFQWLFEQTRKSLVEREIPIDKLLESIIQSSNLPVISCQMPELRKTESVDKAMSTISSYCSFFNYRIVEEIINNLGTERDKTNLKSYQEEFKVYAQHHIFECPSELGEMSEINHTNMFVTLDATYTSYTINHLHTFVSNLRRVLKMPAVSLRLCRIRPGSLKMVFQMPHSVQQAIFPLSTEQEEALSGLGVVQLSCRHYQFTRYEDKEVGVSATDGNSDLTDSKGSSGSKNTCANLASLDDKLAAVKLLGGGFSVADLALGAVGSSSVAGVSTAGVTKDLINPQKLGMGCDITKTRRSDLNEAALTIKSTYSLKDGQHQATKILKSVSKKPLKNARKKGGKLVKGLKAFNIQ